MLEGEGRPGGGSHCRETAPHQTQTESVARVDLQRQSDLLSSGLHRWLDYEGPKDPESQLFDLSYPGLPSSVRNHPFLTVPPVGRDVKMITNGLVLVSPSLHQRMPYLLPPHRPHSPGRYCRHSGAFGETHAGAVLRRPEPRYCGDGCSQVPTTFPDGKNSLFPRSLTFSSPGFDSTGWHSCSKRTRSRTSRT